MWKLIVGFIAFAALALFILSRSGGNIDLGGEKHDVTAHEPAASEAASAPMPVASETSAQMPAPASAASQ